MSLMAFLLILTLVRLHEPLSFDSKAPHDLSAFQFRCAVRAFWTDPGSGIVVDARGRVYFSEAGDIDAHLPGAIWQIDAQGKLSRLQEGGAHYLALDAKRGFAPADLSRWFGQRVTPWLQRADTPDASLIQADGQPI